MKLCKRLLLIVVLFSITISYSQNSIRTSMVDTTSNWVGKNTIGLDLSEISFLNWSAGGNSSISGLIKGNFHRNYRTQNVKWSNELIVRYGVNKQDGVELRKTDDAFNLNSTFGYRKDSLSNWYHSAKFNFNSQFTNGYAYPNIDKPISKPFAPAYLFVGVGAEYSNKDKKVNVYISPLTMKTTLVLDTYLANQGAFGVTKAGYDSNGTLISKGKRSKSEFGLLLTASNKKEVIKNITMDNKLSLYSDYINKFGNVDVDWQLQFDLVVNQYVKANIGTHLLYDDDIKTKKIIDGQQITLGPKVQLKQMLGIGFVYNFI